MRAAVYIRVSTEEQAKEGFSLEAQKDRCMAFIESQGYSLIKVYMDDGYSAKNMNRPRLQELLEDCKKRVVNLVVVYKLDRLSRSVFDSQVILNHFEKYGVKFKSTMEEFETITAGGRMFLNLMSVIAQWEREQIAERVTMGLTKRAQLGKRNTGTPPLGYKMGDNFTLEIDEDKAGYIRTIFDMYARGIGSRNIQKEISRMGYRTRNETNISQQSIIETISNPVFIGTTHWKARDTPESSRILTENTHPALVSRELYDKAQTILRRKRNKEISRSSFNYAFSGVLKCANCGYSLNGHTTRKKNVKKEIVEYRNYHCYGKHGMRACTVPDITELKVERIFFDEVIKELNYELEQDEFEKSETKQESKDADKERKRLEKKILECKKILDNWAYAMGKGAMTMDRYISLSKPEEEKLASLQYELNNFVQDTPEQKRIAFEELREFMVNLKEYWPKMTLEHRKESVQGLFKRIEFKYEGEWKLNMWELV
jgi:site-specific DNA recombinase